MTHPRTQLRNLTVQRLLDATDAGQRVHSGRLMPLSDDEDDVELPAIIVHTRQPEEISDRSVSGWNGYERRRAVISVVCVRQSHGDLEEELDAMAQQVEDSLQSWTIPGFESAELRLLETSSRDPEFDGSLTTGSTTLRYGCTYLTPFRACSDPYVLAASTPLERSGAYPGGRVTPGCPAGNTGEACPIEDAELFADGEQIN
jgi:hypothetical protein